MQPAASFCIAVCCIIICQTVLLAAKRSPELYSMLLLGAVFMPYHCCSCIVQSCAWFCILCSSPGLEPDVARDYSLLDSPESLSASSRGSPRPMFTLHQMWRQEFPQVRCTGKGSVPIACQGLRHACMNQKLLMQANKIYLHDHTIRPKKKAIITWCNHDI